MIDYTPPTAADLAQLKDRLGCTGTQMAELVSVAGNSQWRKYTGGASPRPLNLHMCFFLAARLTLDDAALARVAAAMQSMGAQIDPQALAVQHPAAALAPVNNHKVLEVIDNIA